MRGLPASGVSLARYQTHTRAALVLFFGNTASRQAELTAALGDRAVFGFPAAGGSLAGPVVRYVLIRQQKTMLGERDGTRQPPRSTPPAASSIDAGFPTLISAHIEDWLMAHAAFVAPIAFALYRVGGDPTKLAADPVSIRLMVLATRQAFTALRVSGNDEIPSNLRILYGLPTRVVTGYWRRVLNSPRGELWFGARSRAAPEEMRNLADQLQAALRHTGHPTPDLTRLLATGPLTGVFAMSGLVRPGRAPSSQPSDPFPRLLRLPP